VLDEAGPEQRIYMEFEPLASVCTIAASHEFAAIVTGLLRIGQSENEPIVTKKYSITNGKQPQTSVPHKSKLLSRY